VRSQADSSKTRYVAHDGTTFSPPARLYVYFPGLFRDYLVQWFDEALSHLTGGGAGGSRCRWCRWEQIRIVACSRESECISRHVRGVVKLRLHSSMSQPSLGNWAGVAYHEGSQR
jgi:hypothetical protein